MFLLRLPGCWPAGRGGHSFVPVIVGQQALGHRNINSTVAYLSFREEDVELAILAAASRVLAA